MLALAGLVAGCAWGGHNGTRLLPADRGAAVMYVALGDSTVVGVGASSPERNYVSRGYARLPSAYPDAPLANLGGRGPTSRIERLRPSDRSISLGPHLVT